MAILRAKAKGIEEKTAEVDDVLGSIRGTFDYSVAVETKEEDTAMPPGGGNFRAPFLQDMLREQVRYLRELQGAGVHDLDGVSIELLLDSCAETAPPESSSCLGDGFDYLDEDSPPPAGMAIVPIEDEYSPQARLALLPPDDVNFSSSSCVCRTGMHDASTGCRYVELPPAFVSRMAPGDEGDDTDCDDEDTGYDDDDDDAVDRGFQISWGDDPIMRS